MRAVSRRGKCFIILVKAPAEMLGAGSVSALTHGDDHLPTKDSGLCLVYRGKIAKNSLKMLPWVPKPERGIAKTPFYAGKCNIPRFSRWGI